MTFLDHTQFEAHTLGRTHLNAWSARRRARYLQRTQQTQETNILILSGIRTRDPSKRAAADSRPTESARFPFLMWINYSLFTKNDGIKVNGRAYYLLLLLLSLLLLPLLF